MASPKPQYHHYIPRFILRQFAHAEVETRRSTTDGLLHVFDVATGEFRLGEVGKTCGDQNLYYNDDDTNPMRIEQLFRKLECQTNLIFSKITTAVAEGRDHIDVLEKDVRIIFKFMHLSVKRSQQYRDDLKDPYHENDFLVQWLLEDARKRGRTGDPGQLFLENLLYLLETGHEQLLEDAEKAGSNPSLAGTYKHFTENYTLQIWKAAGGYEFFLNERLVDFEGDTTCTLGIEKTDAGPPQLIWVTSEDLIHQILPISPDVALVFCDESRCWDSPFADAMHRAKIPYPANSLLSSAPHKDIISISVPRERRGKKNYPATSAWRVSIAPLSRPHHRIITCYALSHAKSLLVVRRRARFERARRELPGFNRERAAAWKRQGIRCYDPDPPPAPNPPTPDDLVRGDLAALDSILALVKTTREPLPRSKANSFKAWRAMFVLKVLATNQQYPSAASSDGPDEEGPRWHVHPALKKAFEAAYPPKPPTHRDLIEVDFADFVDHCVGEEYFVKLSTAIDAKILELVRSPEFDGYFDAAVAETRARRGELLPVPEGMEKSVAEGKEIMENTFFKSVVRAAEGFEVMRWLFEERQDVLAGFVEGLVVKGGWGGGEGEGEEGVERARSMAYLGCEVRLAVKSGRGG